MAAYLDETGYTIDQRMSVKGAKSSICNHNTYLKSKVQVPLQVGGDILLTKEIEHMKR